MGSRRKRPKWRLEVAELGGGGGGVGRGVGGCKWVMRKKPQILWGVRK